ncbi:Rqc2 family fibronectin-binding protein [Carboxydothermus ferrireducens]|uniref:Rqc2 homolog RqcH n=1 Tax=Carboxydothermus ferrireducens DSM 11255 TaxID=1119529 RepID=A0ABX2RBE2_9THEO|nr:NFACT family protein [Carboxydothermus ferrireducens]NYE58265.1 putative ribosome quality control (RQC) complex YloA/Tae2 family protein [Carboxydothermus ferrireducens DSM 11255]
MNYLLLKAVVEELSQTIIGHRVDRIAFTDNLSILINFFHPKEKEKFLYLSANNDLAAIFLTKTFFSSSKTTTPFLNSCQNILLGKRLFKINLEPWERNVCLEFLDPKTNDKVYLFVEIMGKHSNLILVNHDQTIIDGIKRYGENQSRYREVLPGKPYIPPPQPEVLLIHQLTLEKFQTLFLKNPNLTLGEIFKKNIVGLGNLLLNEVFFHCNLNVKTPGRELSSKQIEDLYFTLISLTEKEPKPVLYYKEGIPYYPAPFEFASLENLAKKPGTANEICEEYYLYFRELREIANLKNSLSAKVAKKIKNLQERINELKIKVKEYSNAEQFKNFGDLLLTYKQHITKGSSIVKLPNWDGQEVEIPLDAGKSAVENAEFYYKKYHKAKNGLISAQNQLNLALEELDYFKTVQFQIDDAQTLEVLEDIKQELGLENNIKVKKVKDKHLDFLTFTTSSGLKVFVGKSNRQNDYLTFKVAKDNDIWLHAKNIPGAHVILKTDGEPDQQSLLEAAVIAATFSRARYGKKIPVDYTLRKHVQKPAGAKPGFVIYRQEKTIYVDPDLSLLHFRLPGLTTGTPSAQRGQFSGE